MSVDISAFYHRSLYPLIAAIFCALLLISNIGATKFIDFGFIKTDGGAFLFPLTYILGDVLTEVYGFKAARRVIYTGFGLGALAGFTFWLVQIAQANGQIKPLLRQFWALCRKLYLPASSPFCVVNSLIRGR